MAESILKQILKIFHNKADNSKDHLEVYPEKVHVRALPERRYLKTSRFLAISCLMSILFNFAMCFIYMRNTGLVDRIVHDPQSLYTYLYSFDYYNKELKPVEKTFRRLTGLELVKQSLIRDFLQERYEVTQNMEEMSYRWGRMGKMAAYLSSKNYENFVDEAKDRLALLGRGISQKVYVYSVRSVNNGNFYEALFDVFNIQNGLDTLDECRCYEQNKECLQCLRDSSDNVRRYKAYMRISVDLSAAPEQQIVASINPYAFQVKDYYLMEYKFIPEKEKKNMDKRSRYSQWEDVDNILE